MPSVFGYIGKALHPLTLRALVNLKKNTRPLCTLQSLGLPCIISRSRLKLKLIATERLDDLPAFRIDESKHAIKF